MLSIVLTHNNNLTKNEFISNQILHFKYVTEFMRRNFRRFYFYNISNILIKTSNNEFTK